jgi:tRNA pseudouridine55 synthase
MIVRDGLMLVDKPVGMTSHDVVDFIRARIKSRRVGHAGILDPAATGLMLMLLGKGTKFSSLLVNMSKRYVARFLFGVETDTFDSEGRVVLQADPGKIEKDEFNGVLGDFTGEVEQIIPPFSAAKRGGVPSYKLARKGERFTPGHKVVRIDSVKIVDFKWPEVALDISCSAGTYVRSMAHQMGKSLGCGGHLKSLRRMKIGHFSVSAALTIDEIKKASEISGMIRSLREALPASPAIYIKPQYYGAILNGRPFMKKYIAGDNYSGDGGDISILMGPDEKILALARLNNLWNAMDKLGPSEILGTYVRIIDEGCIRAG